MPSLLWMLLSSKASLPTIRSFFIFPVDQWTEVSQWCLHCQKPEQSDYLVDLDPKSQSHPHQQILEKKFFIFYLDKALLKGGAFENMNLMSFHYEFIWLDVFDFYKTWILDFLFSSFQWVCVWKKRHKKGVKINIYPCFVRGWLWNS